MTVGTEQGIHWLKSLQAFGIRPGLQRMHTVLEALGHPERELRFLHIAGTNGKGSVCADLAALISVSHRVGMFTSPAFNGFRGSFSVNGQEPVAGEFSALAQSVRAVSERALSDDMLTEFEALTIMAILYFARQQVDAVVWEAGLGGREDSTNVVNPVVTAVTNVSYDHMEVLGTTLRSIAGHKAGIIKQDTPVVTAAEGEALDVLVETARVNNAPLYVHGVQFGEVSFPVTAGTENMHYRGICRDIFDVPVGLYGTHQLSNASLALAVYELAGSRCGWNRLTDEEVRVALSHVRWPGRFEVHWDADRPIVLDGAHNPDGARQLYVNLKRVLRSTGSSQQGWTVVVGILQDKDARPMLEAILPLAARVIVTAPNSSRAANPLDLAKHIEATGNNVDVEIVASVKDALHRALGYTEPVCCFGSLYTVSEARKAILQQEELRE